jgi:hypothetical protein
MSGTMNDTKRSWRSAGNLCRNNQVISSDAPPEGKDEKVPSRQFQFATCDVLIELAETLQVF